MGACFTLPLIDVQVHEATSPFPSEDQCKSLDDLCKEKNIPVLWFSNPMLATYEEARLDPIEGGLHNQFPPVITQPKTKEDVSTLLKWSVDNDVSMSVRSGGHGSQGLKGSMVIDLKYLNSVVVDTAAKTVTIGGGCKNKEVDTVTCAKGLAVTLGNAGSVGSVGAMLGGGVGFLARYQGLTIDGLLSAEVALADGSIVKAEKKEGGEHAELLWALRGGGGNFGIVVECTIQAQQVGFDPSPDSKPDHLYAGARIVRHDNGPYTIFANGMGEVEVFKAWRDYTLTAPDFVSCDCLLPSGGPMIQLYTCKCPYEHAAEEAKKWGSLGSAAVTDLGPRSYSKSMQADLEKQVKPDLPMVHKWRVVVLGSMPDSVVEALMHASNAGRPNDHCIIHCERLGGKIDKPDDGEDGSAYAHRDGLFWMSIIGIYTVKGKPVTQDMKTKVDAWMETLFSALQPHIVNVRDDGAKAVGTCGWSEPESGAQYAFNTFGQDGSASSKRVARLMAVKAKYDPTNVFKFVENGMSNVTNIDPAAGVAKGSITEFTEPSSGAYTSNSI